VPSRNSFRAIVATLVVLGLARSAGADVPDAGVPVDAGVPADASPVPEAAPQPSSVDAAPGPAAAATVAPSQPETQPETPPAWASAPRPDRASGIARAAPTPITDHVRWIPRVLLFVPRWALWIAAQPIRLGVWAYQRYQIPERLEYTLFSVDDTGVQPVPLWGFYPTAIYETGFGINAGIRFVHKNLGGHRERLLLKANFGGRFRQAYGFSLSSGQRFGRDVRIVLDGLYERRPHERFFGIGNADELATPPAMPIDPTISDAAVSTRFRKHLWRGVLTADVPVRGALGLRLSTALIVRNFGSADFDDPDAKIEDVYDVDRLPGFQQGVDNLYSELEVVYDTRRPTSGYQSQVLDATGWFLAGHLGATTGLTGDLSDFIRYGGEVQRYFDLYRGTRVLALRVLVEAVAGGNGGGKISFIDLPRLGGSEILRGYPTDRFRDRAITVATAEYTWDLGNFLAAYTFVDAGRAWPSLVDIDPREGIRVGFGGGVQFHTHGSFITRGQVAASREGDVFLELVLSPAFGRRERTGRL
jgi:hypothetical protein